MFFLFCFRSFFFTILVNYPDPIFCGYHRSAFMKERNPLSFSQYFRTWLYTRLVFNQIMWISFCESFSLQWQYDGCILYLTFSHWYRVVQVPVIRNLSQKTTLRMIPIQKAGLHFFEFRAQGQRICKLFKLIRYFLILSFQQGIMIVLWRCYLSGFCKSYDNAMVLITRQHRHWTLLIVTYYMMAIHYLHGLVI